MFKTGLSVRVIYPEYVSGRWGTIQAQENSRRWIVQLDGNPFHDNDKPLLLSLEESDFEVIPPKQ